MLFGRGVCSIGYTPFVVLVVCIVKFITELCHRWYVEIIDRPLLVCRESRLAKVLIKWISINTHYFYYFLVADLIIRRRQA